VGQGDRSFVPPYYTNCAVFRCNLNLNLLISCSGVIVNVELSWGDQMPRKARQKSETGIYHVMMRGINKQDIFFDHKDKLKFLELVLRFKEISQFELYGYCLMDNHIHFLLKELTEPLSVIIKRISGSYVYWFNKKYDRCGHLFQERYKSEPVENDSYFLTVLRYIHQNPVQADLADNIPDYQWSSFNEYIGSPSYSDTEFALKMFSDDREKALELFRDFTCIINDDRCLDYKDNAEVRDDVIRTKLVQNNINDREELLMLEKEELVNLIKALKSIDGVTLRQLSRVTGLSKSALGRF